MSYSFGSESQSRMKGLHPDLIRVLNRAIQLTTQDFKVQEGVRSPERQRELYAQGRTKPGKKVTWTLKSNHFIQSDGFGHAADLVPYPVDWDTSSKFDAIAMAMFKASRELGIPIRWGANWDGDDKPREKGEYDSPHFELVR